MEHLSLCLIVATIQSDVQGTVLCTEFCMGRENLGKHSWKKNMILMCSILKCMGIISVPSKSSSQIKYSKVFICCPEYCWWVSCSCYRMVLCHFDDCLCQKVFSWHMHICFGLFILDFFFLSYNNFLLKWLIIQRLLSLNLTIYIRNYIENNVL